MDQPCYECNNKIGDNCIEKVSFGRPDLFDEPYFEKVTHFCVGCFEKRKQINEKYVSYNTKRCYWYYTIKKKGHYYYQGQFITKECAIKSKLAYLKLNKLY
tara:strand:- start:127 stop:429 length:303 start_codon:yes stop_codon:yes gene_type:complete